MLLHVLGQGQATRESEGLRVAVHRDSVDVRSTGIGKPEQARDLVECLPGRVIDSFAEHLDITREPAHVQQRRVPARNQQGDRGVLERPVNAEHVSPDVPDQVIDGKERLVE